MDASANAATGNGITNCPSSQACLPRRNPLGRQALGVDGKYLELHRLLLWRQLSASWDPFPCYPRRQPLYLEIGFGNGEYLTRQALERPHHNFLGIELHWPSVRRCLRRLAQAKVDNVRVLQVDAQTALHYLLPDACLAGALALFPCPWPKRQHERFRLFSTSFMGQLGRSLVPGGQALVVTDHAGLKDFARQQADGSGLLLQVVEVTAGYNTKYERRWSGQGQEMFFELHYRKQGTSSSWCRAEEVNMRSLHLDRFEPDALEIHGIHGEIVVAYRNRVHDREQGIWMVLTTVIEDHLQQTFWIEAIRQPQGWSLRPAQGGGFLPTRGVQLALDHLAQLSGVARGGAPEADPNPATR